MVEPLWKKGLALCSKAVHTEMTQQFSLWKNACANSLGHMYKKVWKGIICSSRLEK